MKKRMTRMLSVMLVLALLMQAPFEALAADGHALEVESTEAASSSESISVSDDTAAEVYIEGEWLEARDEYEKHYRLTDGSFMATQFQVPVHYEDGGEWVDIDNTLQPVAMYDGTEVYQAVNGDHTQAFASTLADGSIMSVSYGNAAITMSLWDGTTGEGVLEEEALTEEAEKETVEIEPEVSEEPAPEETVEEPPVETTPEATTVEETAAEENEAETVEETAAVEEAASGEETIPAETPEAEETSEEEAVAPEETAEPESTSEPEAVIEETPVEETPTEEVPDEETTEETSEPGLPTYNREAVAQVVGSNDAVALAALDEETKLRDVTDVVPDTLSSTVLYEDVYPNVDLKYETFSYNIKESIILNAPANQAVEINASEEAVPATIPYTYTFLLNLDGLTPELQEDGSILLLNTGNEAEFIIPAPYMVDSNEIFSEDVWYTLEQIDEGWLLTVEADAAWLEAEDRAYPVVIDPTIISKRNESKFVGGTAAQNSASTSVSKTWMAVGYHSTHGEMRAYFKITDLPALDPGCTVVNASVGLNMVDYIPQYSSSAKSTLSMHQVTEATSGTDWLTNLTWSNKPDYGDSMDYVVTHGNEIDYILYWDITRAAKGWYEGSTENYGLVITSDQSESTAYRAWFDYSGYAILTVTYRNTTGTESYYTYETQSAVRAGIGYVGDYSSALTVAKSDLSYPNTAMNYSLGHVFNSGLRAGNLSDAALEEVVAPDYSSMKMGKGWQLTAQESMQRATIGSTNYVVYRDSDGTQHYFPQTATYTFKDEDGLGLTVTAGYTTGNLEFSMEDQEGNIRYFFNGYLMYIMDGNGNKICYLYNDKTYSASSLSAWTPPASGAQLTSIVSVNKGQTTPSTICTLDYDENNYLTSITDYAARVTSFTYSSGRLTQITHPDGTIAYYGYNSAGHLTSMYDGESKYGIEYGYQGDGVSSIKEYTATSASGTKTYGAQVKRYKNGVQEAVYRYDGADRTFNTADDIVNRYAFDYFGRTINATTLDNDESDILGVTAAAYTENSGTSKANNRMEKDAQTGQNGVNLLVAGGAESHDSFSTPSSYWTRISTDSRCNAVVKTGELVRTGTSALKIWLATNAPEDANGDRRHGMYQSVTLESGKTYTFSGYVNTQQITKFGDGGGLYVAFADSSGNILAAGDKVTSVTNQEIENGWQRVYATYTPTASGKYRVVIMQENAYPYAFFDDLQLEVGSVPSNANLLQNGSFNGSTEWTLGNYSTASGDSLHPGVVSATGSPTAMKRGSQTVPINASATETFLLSGWGWAPSVANTEEKLTDSTAESNTTKRYFGLIAKCTYTDATKEYFYMPFNDDYNGWQYTSCVIAPKKANQSKTIESITVIMAYDCNANTVWFDNISLRQEPCTTYTYDSEGNVTAVNATGNSGADFTYASGTTKLTKSVTEDSGTYTYEYTDSRNDHLVTKIKNDGVSLSITYDAMGNSTATTLSSDSNTSIGSIKTAATYSTDGSQLMTQTDSNGYTTTYTYNAQRQMNSTTDHNNTTVRQTYYASGRPQQAFISGVVNALNTYSDGMLTRVTRGGYIPNNSTKQNQYYYMAYDAFGNMTSIDVGSRNLATYTYGSKNGNLQSMTYGNGAVVSYAYDNLDRVTHEYWNGTLKYQYFYNSEGNLAKKLDVTTNKAVNYEYDSLGRLIHSYQTSGNSIVQKTEHIYDTENRIVSQSWQLGDTVYSENYTYDEDDGSLKTMSPAVGEDVSFTYDALKRLSTRSNEVYTQTYFYRDISESQTTTQVERIGYANHLFKLEGFSIDYTYDNVGNIKAVTSEYNSAQAASYTYDQQGQLLTETNYKGSYTYAYDTYGNIRSVSGAESHSYTYADDKGWYDLLTAYDGHGINYDAIGNPTNWYNTKDWTFTWQNGRQLAAASDGTTNISYTYDVAGIRDSKTVDGITYNYLTQNGQVVQQTWTDTSGSHVMDFIYDNNGRPYAVKFDGFYYYYILNQQGDVIRILAPNGQTVANYVYDAWGNIIYTYFHGAYDLGPINPIRYRGYYYDTETGLYYLGSRYYDPAVKRFVNADGLASTGQGFMGYNMFAYCLNNPVNYVDVHGNLAITATLAATNFWNPVGWVAAAAFVVESTIVTACVIAMTYEAFQQVLETPADSSGSSTVNASKSNKKQQAQVETKAASTPASPQPPRNNKDNKYRGGTLYNKAGVRVDYEYYGNGNGNVHMHINGNKYYFSPSLHQFVDAAGHLAPKAIQNLRGHSGIAKAILRGLKYISG